MSDTNTGHAPYNTTATAPHPCLLIDDAAALSAAGIAYTIEAYRRDRYAVTVPAGQFDAAISACAAIN